MADEASDCEHIERMAIVLKFFDEKENKPIETLIRRLRIQSPHSLLLMYCAVSYESKS